ncbi:dihydrofolate reductase [Malassezia furfur]|uniref:Dihydrofolate reductase n=1 Tax=Malassezia furfur TaxID=55194 RepID=A0ABY8EQX1_MALFU|nr:hypothetical protein CBS14141_003502 [Malassezia furfur]WFD47282.1 dihydrofolate reductase [Malassezia furfur]
MPANAAASGAKLRVLVLHGFAQNSYVFKRRTSALQKACRNVVDFVFLNAPIQVKAFPSEANPDPKSPSPSDPEEEQARAWWRQIDDAYVGWDGTARYLQRAFQEQGPFDGVLGFSQGGCLAGVLAAALEHPELVPDSPGTFQAQPFRFAVSVSGFRPRAPLFDRLMEARIATPMLVIQGREDSIVTPAFTETLVQVCDQVRVAEHDGGHYLPTPAPWRNFLRDFFASFLQEEPGAWRSVPLPTAADDNSDPKL